MTFSLILFLLTVFTGVLWVLDVFVWKPKRVKVMSDELQQFDRSNEDALRRGVQSVVAARSAMVIYCRFLSGNFLYFHSALIHF